MLRAGFYIDGFNMYGAIHELSTRRIRAGQPSLDHLKWLSYSGLAAWMARSHHKIQALNGHHGFLEPMNVEFVNFYTAIPPTHEARLRRHQRFIDACESQGVRVHIGSFKPNNRTCVGCGGLVRHNEEKETDVHIAVDVVCDSLCDLIDVAFVLTTDSDIAPAFRCVRAKTGVDLIAVAIEPRPHSKELYALAQGAFSIKQIHLEKNLLPAQISATPPIFRPSKYAPPS